ncbi:hypothetical protein WAI453_007655 [Rhynchosporium graminicola]
MGHTTVLTTSANRSGLPNQIAVIEILKTKYYISALDIVIVRAGISEAAPSPVASMPLTGIQIHLQINGIALVFWCQAVFPLLEQRAKFMQTDLVNAGAKAVALEKAYTTIDEGAMGFVKRVDAATK